MTTAPAWILRFAREEPAAGAHLLFRYLGFRGFDEIERRVPASGRILDAGCGHGLLAIMMAERFADRDVLGIDLLDGRLDAGRRVARRHGIRNLRLERVDLGDLPDGPFDAITVCDVLLYSPLDTQRRFIEACAGRLAPGGLLLVKEQVCHPRWKAALVDAQERVVVGARRLFEGGKVWEKIAPSGTHLWETVRLEDRFRRCGLEVESVPLHRGSYLSHHLVTGRASVRELRTGTTGPLRSQGSSLAGSRPGGTLQLS